MGVKLKELPTDFIPSVIMVFEHLLPNKWAQEKIPSKMKSLLMPELNNCGFMMLIWMWFLM